MSLSESSDPAWVATCSNLSCTCSYTNLCSSLFNLFNLFPAFCKVVSFSTIVLKAALLLLIFFLAQFNNEDLSTNRVSAKKSVPNRVSCFVTVLGKVFVNLNVCSNSAKLVNFLSFKILIIFACKVSSSIIAPTLAPRFSKFLLLDTIPQASSLSFLNPSVFLTKLVLPGRNFLSLLKSTPNLDLKILAASIAVPVLFIRFIIKPLSIASCGSTPSTSLIV